jgi:hypothetical protein
MNIPWISHVFFAKKKSSPCRDLIDFCISFFLLHLNRPVLGYDSL